MKAFTAGQIRQIDRAATQRYMIPVLLLMENAGRCVAEAARELLRRGRGRRVIVVCGYGHNGGDGVVAARLLQGWGYAVQVFFLKSPSHWTGDMAAHYRMAKRLGVPFHSFTHIRPRDRVRRLHAADVLIDALLGTGAHGHLSVPFFDAIAAMNAARRPIVAVDLPSGLDPDTGRVQDIAIQARVTVTLAAAKCGLTRNQARRYVGKLVVADIGIPHAILQRKPRSR